MAESGRGVATRLAHVGMVAVFALSALVQVNDPDPLRWIAIYVAAAAVAALGAAGRPSAWLAAVVAAVALAWAGSQAPSFVSCLAPGRTCFTSWDMHGDEVAEAAREAGGLSIVAAWCAFAALDAVARRRAASPEP